MSTSQQSAARTSMSPDYRKRFDKDIYDALFGGPKLMQEAKGRLDTLLPSSHNDKKYENYYGDLTEDMKTEWASLTISKNNEREHRYQSRVEWRIRYGERHLDMTEEEVLMFEALNGMEEEAAENKEKLEAKFGDMSNADEKLKKLKSEWDFIQRGNDDGTKVNMREKRQRWYHLYGNREEFTKTDDATIEGTEMDKPPNATTLSENGSNSEAAHSNTNSSEDTPTSKVASTATSSEGQASETPHHSLYTVNTAKDVTASTGSSPELDSSVPTPSNPNTPT